MFLGIDYASWWFLVVGGVFSGYAILDGFDLGAGAWHLFFRKEESRRIALNAIGPVWDGNEVWLVIGGGALFAGFPDVYATLFSAMYIPFMLFLVLLIFRAISIEFRGKEPMQWWKNTWDTAYCVSSSLLAFLLGVVLGNVLLGMEIGADKEFSGSWLSFLNPYAFLTGFTTLSLFMMHGANYLILKTEGRLYARLRMLYKRAMLAFIVFFMLTSVYTLWLIPHLSDDFTRNPWLFVFPLLTMLSIANIPRLASKQKYQMAFLFSALSIAFMMMLVAAEVYPVLLRSTLNPAYSLTVQNAASSEKTLRTMLIFALIGLPLVATYTFFVYRTFRGKVKLDEHSY